MKCFQYVVIQNNNSEWSENIPKYENVSVKNNKNKNGTYKDYEWLNEY